MGLANLLRFSLFGPRHVPPLLRLRPVLVLGPLVIAAGSIGALGLALGRVESRWLEGRRGRAIRTAVSVTVVCAASGLWHGASWTFLAWAAFMAA